MNYLNSRKENNMELIKEPHTRLNNAGGGYKIPHFYKEGGCYRKRIVSSLNLERKEVDACSIHRDNL